MGTSISAILTLTTPALGTPPGPATGLVASNIGTNNFTLSWTAPTTGTTPFTYQVQLNGTPGSPVVSVTNVIVNSLPPATTYTVGVNTSNASGTSTSATIQVTTLSIAPAAPTGLVSTGVTPTSVSLGWTAPATGTPPFTYTVSSRQSAATPAQLFGDDFTTLSLYNYKNPSAGGTWMPASWFGTGVDGYDGGGTWVINPFNLSTQTTAAFYAASNSILSMRLDNTPANILAAVGNDATTGGQLQTNPTFLGGPFGYWEISCAVPKQKGSEFIATVLEGSGQQELNIAIPTMQDGTQWVKWNVWTTTPSKVLNNFLFSYTLGSPPDPSQSHTYGIDLQPATTTLYLDRVQVGQFATPPSYVNPMFWILFYGNATDEGGGQPVTSTLPSFAQVDYVKTWASPPFLVSPPGPFVPFGTTFTTTSGTVTGLSSGTSYDFEVSATNTAGTSPQSAILSGVATSGTGVLPSAPQNPTIGTVTSSSIQVSWTAPASGTTPFTYVLQWTPHGSPSLGTWMNHFAFGGSEFFLGFVNEIEYMCDNGTGNVSSTGYQAFSSASSILSIKAQTTGASGFNNPAGQPWNSGCLTSCQEVNGEPVAGMFNRQFGYFEIRCQVPSGGPANSGPGFWPAFVLYPLAPTSNGVVTGNAPPGEIDIFEILGGSTGTVRQSIHTSVAGQSHEYDYTGAGDTSLAFHTYGVDVQSNFITFYVDNVQTAQQATPSDFISNGNNWYMNCPLSVGGPSSWVGAPSVSVGSTVGILQIDYIGVWTNHGTAYPSGGTTSSKNAALFLDDFNAPSISFNGSAPAGSGGSGAFNSLPATSSLNNTVTSLAQLTSYDFKVFAQNTAGSGPTSVVITGSTLQSGIVPTAPTGLTSTSVATTSVTLSWTAPTTGTTPFTYQTQFSLAGQNTWSNGPATQATSGQVTGLTANTNYDFRVNAANSTGIGPFSSTFTVRTLTTTSTVTWNPTNVVGMVLSNNNLTATASGSSTPYSTINNVVTSTSQSTGKYWIQVTFSNAITQNVSVGFVNVNGGFNMSTQPGTDTHSIGFYPQTGAGSQAALAAYYNNNLMTQPATAVPGDTAGATITALIDVDLQQYWFTSPAMVAAFGAGSYNNLPAAQVNPGSGLGGLSGFPIGTPVFAIFGSFEGGTVGVLNAGSSPPVGNVVPANFNPWGGGTTTATAPSQVTGLVASGATSTTMNLSWSVPTTGTPPITYTPQVAVHGSGTFISAPQTTATSTTISGLTASTSYDFKVFASNAGGTGPTSAVVTASTTAQTTTPGAPTSLTLNQITATSMVPFWQPPTTGAPPFTYTVQYKVSTANTFTTAPAPISSPDGTSITTFGPTFKDNDNNNWGMVNTAGGQVTLNGVTDTNTGNVAQIAWVGLLIYHRNTSNQWYFKTHSTDTWTQTTAPTIPSVQGQSVLVTGLSVGTTYNWQVRATNSSGTGPFSTPLVTATTQGNPPGGGPGPIASSPFMTADFNSPMNYPNGGSGQIIVDRKLWGLSTGGAADNGFSAFANSAFRSSAAFINPGLMRVNGDQANNGAPASHYFNTDSTVRTAAFTNLIQNFYLTDPLGIGSLIVGVNCPASQFGNGAIDGITDVNSYATCMRNLITFLNNATMPNGKKLPIIGFESCNEPDANPQSTLQPYYNAMCDAVNAINPSLLCCGPTTSNEGGDWGGVAFQQQAHRLDVYDYHAYSGGGGGPTPRYNTTTGSGTIANVNALLQPGPKVIFLGEYNTSYNCNDDLAGTYECAMWAAKVIGDLLDNAKLQVWGGIWDYYKDTTCGVIDDNNNIRPQGYLIAQGVRTMYGPRWNVVGNSGLQTFAVAPPGGHVSLMVLNFFQGNKSGPVAFSQWPVNSTGNGTANVWQMAGAGGSGDGARSTVQVTAGVTTSINFPDPSVTIISI